jgi:protoporphyrinogen oxidase
MTTDRDLLVIGGGAAGLAAADAAASAGLRVALLEAGPAVGGLARAVQIGGEPVEAYYHHIFPQDRETLDLAGRLALGPDVEWRPASMGILHDSRVYPFNGPPDLLRFRPLSLPSRVRVGLATAVQLIRRDQLRLDRTPVDVESRRWYGSAAYQLLWQPLLEAKFGDLYRQLPMAWLVARLRQRAAGRRVDGDRLGYLNGSLRRLLVSYAALLERDGVDVVTNAQVRRLRRVDDAWQADVDVNGEAQRFTGRAVVAAVSGEILQRMTTVSPEYAEAIAAIPYRSVVCVLLEMTESISPHYWVNVTDRLGLGCVAIIEHTRFVPRERYAGRHVLYLAHYVDRDSPTWRASVDDMVGAVEPAFRALNPAYQRAWIVDAHVARDLYAQPVPQVGGPMPGLSIRTGVPGLLHASLAHIYPDDRGISLALRLGQRAGTAAVAHLARRSG